MTPTIRDRPTNCPAKETLVLAISSTDTLTPDLAEHIETCRNCQKQLDEMTSGSKLAEYGRIRPASSDSLADVTLGNYRIVKKLGEGGMGLVYEAEDMQLKRRVALKVMKPSAALNRDYRQRFLREAQSAAKVTHDNICPIYQVGEDRSIPFIAMPLLQGETLEQRLRHQPLTLSESLDVLRQAAEGAAAAHAKGLIHRDIKPSNIWLEELPQGGRRVRLLDFGLARCEVNEQPMTLSGTILGTPAYMAPEQARGEIVDQRADLFSLGAVAYEVITGQRAFSGSSAIEVLSRILNDNPASISDLNGKVPESLATLVSGLLQKTVSSRIPTARDLIQRIAVIQDEITGQKAGSRAAVSAPRSDRQNGSQIIRWLATAGFLSILAIITTLVLRTPDGTLIVEFDNNADLRIKDGQLQVHDEQGNLRYTIRPGANQQHLSPGKYMIQVTGVDGLSVDTEAFEMKRGETVTVRVTAKATSTNEALPDSRPIVPAAAVIQFPGKLMVNDSFDNSQVSVLPTRNTADEFRQISGGVYSFTKHVTAARQVIVLPIVKYDGQVKSLGFATQIRAVNGNPFINFCAYNNGTQNRFLSFAIRDGMWQLYFAQKELQGNKWVDLPVSALAFDNVVQPQLTTGNWVEVAGRWSDEDYDLWLNGKHISGGPLPAGLRVGETTALQFCVGAHEAGPATMELATLQVWDQAGITPADAAPTGLPARPPSPQN